LARKYRHKYSETPNIEGSFTKSDLSININTSSGEPGTPGYNRGSQHENSSVDSSANIIRQLGDAFKNLPSLRGDNQVTENCSICFLTMQLRKLKRLKCEHLVHYRCIKEWIMNGRSVCPVCSENIQLV